MLVLIAGWRHCLQGCSTGLTGKHGDAAHYTSGRKVVPMIASFLQSQAFATVAAGIEAVEAGHSAIIRSQLYQVLSPSFLSTAQLKLP